MNRIIPILGLLAAVVMMTGQAARPQASSVSCEEAVTTFTTASYNCTSDLPVKLRFERKVDNKLGRVFYDGPGTLHQPQEVGLNPATTYSYTVSEPVGKRWQVASSGSFRTPPPGQATAGVTPHTITLDGAPFFPTIAAAYHSGCRPRDGVIDSSLAKGALVLYGNCGFPYGNGDDSYLRQHLPGNAWWLEADPQIAARMSLPELLHKNLQAAHGLPDVPNPDILINSDTRLQGMDNQPCGAPETAVGLFEGIRSRSKEQGKPVVDYVFLAPSPRGGNYFDNCLTPTRLRLLFYTAVCGGARGLMTLGDRSNPIEGNRVKPEIMAAAWQLSRVELAIWGPVFFAPPVAVKRKAYRPLVGCAFRDKGVITVFAMNAGPKKMVAKLKVVGIGSRRATIWRETRRIRAKKGVITDRFRKFGVHIYVFA